MAFILFLFSLSQASTFLSRKKKIIKVLLSLSTGFYFFTFPWHNQCCVFRGLLHFTLFFLFHWPIFQSRIWLAVFIILKLTLAIHSLCICLYLYFPQGLHYRWSICSRSHSLWKPSVYWYSLWQPTLHRIVNFTDSLGAPKILFVVQER